MKTHHTPGPWQVNVDDDETSIESAIQTIASNVSNCDAGLIAAAPELLEALNAALEWIDAVPQSTVLPAMPGFDRDWVNGIIDDARRG